MKLRWRARSISIPSVQSALVGAMTLTMQVQIPFCCFGGDGEEEGEGISLATVESAIIKTRVPIYFWSRS